MNKLILTITTLITTMAFNAMAQGWTLSWGDEFTGPVNTFPDSTKWNIEVVANPANNEAQYYTKRTKNVSLNGTGQLELTAYKEVMGNKQYTSGRINTSGKFAQTYGRWEARMKLPAGTGFWPAFWMMGDNNGCGGWPNCGEIDIMENRGRQPAISSSAIHGPGYSGNTPITHTYTLPADSPSFFDDFHIFALEWDTTQTRFYIDGVLHYTVNKPDIQVYGTWVLNHSFYTLLNLAVGGAFDGNQLPPDAAFPAKVTVDYVRVFTKSATTALRAVKMNRDRRGEVMFGLLQGQVWFSPRGKDRCNTLGRGS
jgi:beta-glucanase (GH16 family)